MSSVLIWIIGFGLIYIVLHKLFNFSVDKGWKINVSNQNDSQIDHCRKMCEDLEVNPRTGIPCSGGLDGRGNYSGFKREFE